jgi:sec-independent protein translocase protein TatA
MSIPTGWELILLLGVLVLLFGATKLPTAARSIGQSLRIFKAETKGLRSEDDSAAPGGQQASPPPAAHPQTSPAPQAATPQQALPLSGPQTGRPIEEPQRNIDTSR